MRAIKRVFDPAGILNPARFPTNKKGRPSRGGPP